MFRRAETERTLLFQAARPFRACLGSTVDTQRGGTSRERPSTTAEDDNPPGLHFPSALDGAGDPVYASLPSPPPSAPRVSTLSAACSPRNLSRSGMTRKRSWDSTFRAFVRTERRSPLEETVLSCRCSRARSDSAETRVPAPEAYSLRPAGPSLTRDERQPCPPGLLPSKALPLPAAGSASRPVPLVRFSRRSPVKADADLRSRV